MHSSDEHILNVSDLFAYVDDHREPFLQRLIEYLRRPSISAYGEGIAEVAAYIADVMTQMGLQAQGNPNGWLAYGVCATSTTDRCANGPALWTL